jgi:hypothetical protein
MTLSGSGNQQNDEEKVGAEQPMPVEPTTTQMCDKFTRPMTLFQMALAA